MTVAQSQQQSEQPKKVFVSHSSKDKPAVEVLAKAEPDRADFQRDLSVSYNKVGDLYLSLGQDCKVRGPTPRTDQRKPLLVDPLAPLVDEPFPLTARPRRTSAPGGARVRRPP